MKMRSKMEFTIIRKYYPEGTNGTLYLGVIALCKTIELPYKDNMRNVSCIPEGRYKLRKRYSDKFKWHLEVMDVPDRSLILIHPANDALRELRGCIAPVTDLIGRGKGDASAKAFNWIRNVIYRNLDDGKEVYLKIKS